MNSYDAHILILLMIMTIAVLAIFAGEILIIKSATEFIGAWFPDLQ